MQLLSQRVIPGGPDLERIIARVCGPYVHSEILLDDGRAFSSTLQTGVRYLAPEAIREELRVHAQYWDVIDLPWPTTPEIYAFCDRECGAGYDVVGAVCSGCGLARQHPTKWFCSEISAAIITSASGQQPPGLLCPTALHLWASSIAGGGQPMELKILRTMNGREYIPHGEYCSALDLVRSQSV